MRKSLVRALPRVGALCGSVQTHHRVADTLPAHRGCESVLNLLGIPGVRQPSFRRVVPAAERIAAVSDSAVVARAIESKHNIAFFAIDGALAPGSATRSAIQAIAQATFGVVKGSIRVSIDAAALSLVFDPRRVAFAAIQRILDRKLAGLRLTLLPITIVDRRRHAASGSVRIRTDAVRNRR